MTISSDVRKAGPFAGNGTTTSFPFAFLVFSKDDVVVVFTDADSVESTLALVADYTVTLNADQNASPGGTVDLTAALATGTKLTLTSSVAALQPTDLTNQGGFYPSVITRSLDRLTVVSQQIKEQAARAWKIPISSTDNPDDLGADLYAAAKIAVEAADRVDLGALDAAVETSTTKAAIATTKAMEASASAATASAASDSAYVNANVYASTAAGLAAVADGVQFQVAAADGLSSQRYRRDSASVATAVGVPFPSALALSDGLKPISDVMVGGVYGLSPFTAPNPIVYYFIDQDSSYRKTLKGFSIYCSGASTAYIVVARKSGSLITQFSETLIPVVDGFNEISGLSVDVPADCVVGVACVGMYFLDTGIYSLMYETNRNPNESAFVYTGDLRMHYALFFESKLTADVRRANENASAAIAALSNRGFYGATSEFAEAFVSELNKSKSIGGHIGFAGDSTMAGTGATNQDTDSIPGRVVRVLTAFGYDGVVDGMTVCHRESGSSPQWSGAPWAVNGNNTNLLIGSTPRTFTSIQAGTVVRIVYGNSGYPFNVTIDGVSMARAEVNWTGSFAAVEYSGLANTTHTVVVTPDSGDSHLYGIYVGPAVATKMTNFGVGSSISEEIFARASWQHILNAVVYSGVKVFVCRSSVNDLGANIPTATTISNVINGFDFLSSNGIACALLTPCFRGGAEGTVGAQTEALINAVVAAGYSVFDSSSVYSGYINANNLGMADDTVHPSSLGYAVETRKLLAAMGLI